MSAFSRALAAVQAIATAAWGEKTAISFTCKLDIALDPELGTPVRGGNDTWTCRLEFDPEATYEPGGPPLADLTGVANTGAGALDALLANLRSYRKIPDDFYVPPEILSRAVHAITCAKCGAFRSRGANPDVCVCGHRRVGI